MKETDVIIATHPIVLAPDLSDLKRPLTSGATNFKLVKEAQ